MRKFLIGLTIITLTLAFYCSGDEEKPADNTTSTSTVELPTVTSSTLLYEDNFNRTTMGYDPDGDYIINYQAGTIPIEIENDKAVGYGGTISGGGCTASLINDFSTATNLRVEVTVNLNHSESASVSRAVVSLGDADSSSRSMYVTSLTKMMGLTLIHNTVIGTNVQPTIISFTSPDFVPNGTDTYVLRSDFFRKDSNITQVETKCFIGGTEVPNSRLAGEFKQIDPTLLDEVSLAIQSDGTAYSDAINPRIDDLRIYELFVANN